MDKSNKLVLRNWKTVNRNWGLLTEEEREVYRAERKNIEDFSLAEREKKEKENFISVGLIHTAEDVEVEVFIRFN